MPSRPSEAASAFKSIPRERERERERELDGEKRDKVKESKSIVGSVILIRSGVDTHPHPFRGRYSSLFVQG